MTRPSASIVIPTRDRERYVEAALASIAPQAAAVGAEVIVVDDGPSDGVRALAQGFGAHYEPHPGRLGLNAARNTGVARSSGTLVAFVDDDVRADAGWLSALVDAAADNPDVEVFTGPIRPVMDGPAPRSCGREAAPVTSLELGPDDVRTRYAWGTNMAIRRAALERVGPFDESLHHGGDELEWQERAAQQELPVLYVAAAAVEHRRAGSDARLRALMRTAHLRGRAARRFDVRRGCQPTLARELVTMAGCAAHVLRRRCPAGLTMVAHSAGRLREGLRELMPARAPAREPTPQGDDFLSGESGTVGGLDALRRGLLDEAVDAGELLSGRRMRLRRAASQEPPRRRVLAIGVERAEHAELASAARRELQRSRHEVVVRSREPGGRGKFENLNLLLEADPPDGHDWLVVFDDDVELPRGFLDRFIFLSERFSLALAQPAHRLSSHAAWLATRRHRGSVARETSFVEIGPVTAFSRRTFAVLLPFPDLRMGWGLDMHWSAIAREHGWRCGVVDAVAIRHRVAPAGERYSREEAVAEAREFLAGRPHLSASEAERTLSTHRRW